MHYLRLAESIYHIKGSFTCSIKVRAVGLPECQIIYIALKLPINRKFPGSIVLEKGWRCRRQLRSTQFTISYRVAEA